jgi:DNA polymerase I
MTKILQAHADRDTGAITYYTRDGARVRKHRTPGQWISYLKAEDVTEGLQRMLRNSQHVRGMRREGEWYALSWASHAAREASCDPKEGWFRKQGIDTFEADVPPLRRWLADNAIEIERPRRCYLDIETCARHPMSEKEKQRILTWTVMDDDGNARQGCLSADDDASERALLADLWSTFEGFDQILAWNGDGFDFPMIFSRSALHRITVDARRWLWLDHLELFRRMNTAAESGDEKQSLALQAVSMSVLREGKMEGVGYKQIFPYWQAGGEKQRLLLQYNRHDVDLMRRIEAKTGYVDLLQTLVEVTGVFGDTHGISPMPQVEQYMLRLGKERGVHFQTRQRHEEQSQFAGAFVMEPTARGIARNVHVCDFSSMYPSIILTWNMSPETFRGLRKAEPQPVYLRHLPNPPPPRPDDVCETAGMMMFAKEPRGLLAEALEQMLAMRKQWNDAKSALPPGTTEWVDADRRSTAYKVAANSFFGVVGAPVSRLYVREVASSITGTGVWLIRKTIELAQERGLEAIYGDTDSCFVRGCNAQGFADFVAECNQKLYPRLVVEQGCDESRNRIKLAYEKEFERVVFVSAKRYAGRYAHYKGAPANEHSKPEVKGLEYKRGDGTRLARRLQAEAIELLMGGGVEVPAGLGEPSRKTLRREECAETAEAFTELLTRYREAIFSEAPLDLDDVVQTKKIAKGLHEYASKMKKDGTEAAQPPHIRVAKILRERGEDVREGTRIAYVVVDGSTAPATVIPASDWVGECDRFELWDAVTAPTLRLLEAAFPAVDWQTPWTIRRPRKQAVKAAIGAKATARQAESEGRVKKRAKPDNGPLFSLKDAKSRH